MTQQIIFIIISAITLMMGWIVVTNRNLFHAALALMGSFLGVAGLYVLLEAGFLAAAQLLVYIGAISILVIFAIMMTRRLMQTTETAFNSQWALGGLISSLLFAVILFVVLSYDNWSWEPGVGPTGSMPEVSAAVSQGTVASLGAAFVDVNQYVLPFEVASVLLLAALVGAIVIAWPEKVSTTTEEVE